MRGILYRTAVAVFLAGSIWTTASATGSADKPAWGEPNDGLRLGISVDHSERDEFTIALRVTVSNTGPQDRLLKMGIMLANGRTQYPTAIHLVAIDPRGKTREIGHTRQGHPAVAGRIDPLVVPLMEGASHTVTLVLDGKCTDGSKLETGHYRIHAVLKGEALKKSDTNLDMPGLALMPCWVGTVESGEAEFDFAPAAKEK